MCQHGEHRSLAATCWHADETTAVAFTGLARREVLYHTDESVLLVRIEF